VEGEDGVEFGIDQCQLFVQVPVADGEPFEHRRGADQRLGRAPAGRVFFSADIRAGLVTPGTWRGWPPVLLPESP
jgi:hypothetical protein